MLAQTCWLLSLVAIVVSSSTYSSYNTSISTTITSSTTPINSTHQASTTSSTSSTTGPSSTPSTFYLIANETATEFVGLYVILIPDPEPFIPSSQDTALRFNNKNSTGAANFSLFDNGTLQANSDSGPLYASTPAGESVGDWTLEFADPNELDKLGLAAIACEFTGLFPNLFLQCQAGELREFYYATVGGYLTIGTLGGPLFTLLKTVPT